MINITSNFVIEKFNVIINESFFFFPKIRLSLYSWISFRKIESSSCFFFLSKNCDIFLFRQRAILFCCWFFKSLQFHIGSDSILKQLPTFSIIVIDRSIPHRSLYCHRCWSYPFIVLNLWSGPRTQPQGNNYIASYLTSGLTAAQLQFEVRLV